MIEEKLINLLSIIHRDGGRYIERYGVQKAYDDAVQIVLQSQDLQEQLEEMESEHISAVAELRAEINRLEGAYFDLQTKEEHD